MRIMRDGFFVAVAFNHLVVDLLNGQSGILLVFLALSLGLSNSDIGLITLIYISVGSLTQPLFGLLADRPGSGWLSGASLLWMAVCFSAAVLIPGRWALLALIVGALASGVFHAAGTERATAWGASLMPGRITTAASVFFLFGQAGRSLGSVVGGTLLQGFGASGILALTIVAVPVALNSLYRMHWRIRLAPAALQSVAGTMPVSRGGFRSGKWVLAVFAIMMLVRTVPLGTSTTFLPKLLQDRGYSPAAYGLIASIFMAGVALGGLSGGVLADHWGRRHTVFWTLLAAAVPMYYWPVVSGPGLYPLVFIAGALNGAPHSVIVVLAQALLPRRRALASGMTLGITGTGWALGSYLYGLAADVYPLDLVLQTNGVVCLVSAFLVLLLWSDSGSGRGADAMAG